MQLRQAGGEGKGDAQEASAGRGLCKSLAGLYGVFLADAGAAEARHAEEEQGGRLTAVCICRLCSCMLQDFNEEADRYAALDLERRPADEPQQQIILHEQLQDISLGQHCIMNWLLLNYRRQILLVKFHSHTLTASIRAGSAYTVDVAQVLHLC